jgi:hypothetical protein
MNLVCSFILSSGYKTGVEAGAPFVSFIAMQFKYRVMAGIPDGQKTPQRKKKIPLNRSGKTPHLEEPYAGNSLVRVCGGAGGLTSGATRLDCRPIPRGQLLDGDV